MSIISKQCSIEDCERIKFGKGYCRMHYTRYKKSGDPLYVKKIAKVYGSCVEIGCNLPKRSKDRCQNHYIKYRQSLLGECSIDGCGRNIQNVSLNICEMHYQRHRLGIDYKTPYDPRPAIIEGDVAKIPLGISAKDGYAIVDKEFAYLADEYKWTLSSTGYATTGSSSGAKIKLHRIILGAKDGEYTDHINGNRIDNRLTNLRAVTHQQNMMNVRPRSSNGYKGISRMSQSRITENTRKIWRAYIKPNKKQISLGLHETPEQAAKAYDKAAKEYFGEYAYLNFPD